MPALLLLTQVPQFLQTTQHFCHINLPKITHNSQLHWITLTRSQQIALSFTKLCSITLTQPYQLTLHCTQLHSITNPNTRRDALPLFSIHSPPEVLINVQSCDLLCESVRLQPTLLPTSNSLSFPPTSHLFFAAKQQNYS